MKRAHLAVLLAVASAAAPAFASGQPAPSPGPTASSSAATPAPGPSPTAAITASAKDWLHRLQTGNVDRAQLDAKMNAALTDAQVAQVKSQFAALGDPSTFTFLDSRVVQGITVYSYRVAFASGGQTWTWIYALDSDGKIAGLFLRPAA